jgi:tetratricopeptide (TPR) repeat protein
MNSGLTQRINAALGKAYLAKGETVDAKRLFEELRNTASRKVLPVIERGLADVALHEGRYRDAVALFESTAAEYEGSDDTYHRIWALDGLARARVEAGDPEGTIKAYQKAVASAKKVRGIFRSKELRVGFSRIFRGSSTALLPF